MSVRTDLRDRLVTLVVFGSIHEPPLGTGIPRGWRGRLYIWWLNAVWDEIGRAA